MKHEDLFLLDEIFNSDDDAEVVEDIFAGYDETFNLIILLEHTSYDEPECNCCTYALVEKDEAFLLSKKLSVPMTHLVDVLKDSVKSYRRLVNPTLRQTRDCFSDILRLVSHNGCRYTLHRTHGADGYKCY